MSAKKRWSEREKQEVIRLRFQDGMQYKDIANIVRPNQSTAWRKVGEICREYEKQRDEGLLGTPQNQETPAPSAASPSTITTSEVNEGIKREALVSMSREERVRYLMARLKQSARGKAILLALDADQQIIFAEMYHEVVEEFDSLTSAEDQMLMQAILAYCMYLRACQLSSQAEQAFMLMMAGKLEDDDPKRAIAGVADRYKRDMETKHKEYVTLMDKLKATRDQRLKSVTDQRKTFGEMMREYATKDARNNLIKDILAVEKMSDDELKRMLEGGPAPDGTHKKWLIGDFSEYEQ
jgi:transposase-like protein